MADTYLRLTHVLSASPEEFYTKVNGAEEVATIISASVTNTTSTVQTITYLELDSTRLVINREVAARDTVVIEALEGQIMAPGESWNLAGDATTSGLRLEVNIRFSGTNNLTYDSIQKSSMNLGSFTTQYTVPAGKQAIISAVAIEDTNSPTGTNDFSLRMDNNLYYTNTPVTGGVVLNAIEGTILDAGDTIDLAGGGGTVNLRMSIKERTI